jgi:hypothetical protein
MKALKTNNILPSSIRDYVKIFFLVAINFSLHFSCKPEVNNSKNARIKFNKARHDFGTVGLNKEVSHTFKFSNPGKNNLVIHQIKTSCGCTAVHWPKEPLEEGENEKIHVLFDASIPGIFRKTVTVYYNGKESPDTLLIEGKVAKNEDNLNRKYKACNSNLKK